MGILNRIFRRRRIPPPPIHDGSFVDLDIPITDMQRDPSGATRFVVRGIVAGEDIGFAFTFDSTWEDQSLKGNFNVSWGSGAFERTGSESDRFVALIAGRYNFPAGASSPRMIERIAVQVVGIGSNPALAGSQGTHTKVFFHSDSEDEERYAEVFVNINLETRCLEFHEKDNEYRVPLVRALTDELA